MSAKHITAARERGPKAGLKLYLGSTSPLARERQADILAADDKLVRYCEIFGSEIFGKNGPSAPAIVARVEHDEDNRDATLYQRFLAFLKSEGEDVSDIPGATIEVVEDDDDTIGVGDTFSYTGKSGTSAWKVLRKGKTKRGKPAFICSNGKRESAWNVKTLAVYQAEGKVVKA